MDFKPVTIEDNEIFKKYLRINQYQNSEYNLSTMIAWQVVYQIKYAIIEDCLCIVGQDKGFHYSYFPLGEKENTEKALYVLKDYFKQKNLPFVLMSLSVKMIEMLEEFGMRDLFTENNRRDFADYVYLREKLVSLSGKKLHGKRNHFNYFQSHYSYELVPITLENESDCRELLKSLILERSLSPGEELNATMMILMNRDELGLVGRALYVDNNLAGVILGECHHGVSVIQIAKSNVNYRGVAVALFKLFLEDNLTHCTYVNFMEDLGIEGLRKAKLSYDPIYFIEKTIFTLKE